MSKKLIIAFEGVEGSGKSFHLKQVAKYLKSKKIKFLKVSMTYNGPLQAPIKKDDVIGKLKVVYKDDLLGEYDLLAFENVKKLNVFSRLIKSINFLIWGDV